MVHVLGCFRAKPEFRAEVKAALLGVRTGSVEEEGCLGIRLYEDRHDPDLFYGDERFVDADAVEFHRAQSYEVALMQVAEKGLVEPPVAFLLEDAIVSEDDEVSRSAEPGELVAIAVFDFKPGLRDAVIAAYERQIPNVRGQESCISFNVYPVIGQPSQLVVIEWWTSPSAARQFATTDGLSIETGQLLASSLIGPVPEYLHELTEMFPKNP
ncbi:antibiotic biosynthesis monooxygenase [Salinibacterium sp. SWN167]|nr:antibiotic biosynthesis monooxygenase [Salinibacterium sp. SWN167]